MKNSRIRNQTRYRKTKIRRGAAMLETAMSMMVFLSLVFGMLDLGLGVLRHQQLTDASRYVARQAAVHGAFADRLGTWGVAPLSGTANDGSTVAELFKQRMLNNDLANITFTVSWIDGGNEVRNDDRVQVTATAPYRPFVTFVFGSPTITLNTVAIVPIAH